jgi:lipopolysaccharide transport system permease protein
MSESHKIIITPQKSVQSFWRELWDYRDLFYFLAWRDFKVRYKQTMLGVVWAVIRPLITMLIFSILFGRIAKLPSEGGAPYQVMVFSAMLPWYFFSSTMQDSSQSLVMNANMITKIYFPRLIIPISTLFVTTVDFLISLVIFFLMMVWLQFLPTIKVVWLPLFFLQAAVTSVGMGLWLSALCVSYRDFRHIVPFMLQIGLYVSPVAFSSSLIPTQWQPLYALNPMVGVIDGFRWCFLNDTVTLEWHNFGISLASGLLLFISGLWFFQRVERNFADVI